MYVGIYVVNSKNKGALDFDERATDYDKPETTSFSNDSSMCSCYIHNT